MSAKGGGYMEKEICSNCKYSQLVRLPISDTREGIHSSDKHIDMYICHHRKAQHYGHLMLGDHSCLGFKVRVAEKTLKERKPKQYSGL